MKTYLFLFYGLEKELPALKSAFEILKHFGGHLKVLHIMPQLDYTPISHGYDYYALSNDVIERMEAENEEQAGKAQALFLEVAKEYDLPVVSEDNFSHNVSASWFVCTKGRFAPNLLKESRLCDLVILHKDISENVASYYEHAASIILFDARCPILLVTDEDVLKPTNMHSLVAWDSGLEAEKAIMHAMPFLQVSEKIDILLENIAENKIEPDGNDVKTYLLHHGVQSKIMNVKDKKLETGEAILKHAKNLKANLLVMGAYGHSRIREALLGGVTKHVLKYAHCPVLLSHY